MTHQDELQYWQGMAESANAAMLRTQHTLDRAQQELAQATEDWEAADCPDDGETAYLYERAAVWERHCRERHQQARQQVDSAEGQVRALDPAARDL